MYLLIVLSLSTLSENTFITYREFASKKLCIEKVKEFNNTKTFKGFCTKLVK